MKPMKCLGVTMLLCLAQPLVTSAAEFEPPIVLESPNASREGWFGAGSVSAVPDVNGDGKADILVCAVSEFAGRVYLFDGATRELLRELRSPNENSNSGFGYRATGIEDVNGDGRGDIIVGTGSGENRVYVIDGATGEPIHTVPQRGHSLSSVPDVNGDGRPDLAVGTVDFGSRSGTVRIYDGANGTQLRSFNGGGFFGLAVSGIPDVNGDGAGDVIVGAWMDNRAYIHDGATGTLLHTLSAPGDPFRFGWVVNRLPDVDGDSRDDVVVAGFQDYNQSRIPADAYVFSGASGELLATLPGHSDYGGGRSIAGLPDVNGDGASIAGELSLKTASGQPQGEHLLPGLDMPQLDGAIMARAGEGLSVRRDRH